MSLAGLALDALYRLLGSSKGSDARAGLEAFRAIYRLGTPEASVDGENTVQTIYNILNVRGDVPPEVLDMVNPLKELPSGR